MLLIELNQLSGESNAESKQQDTLERLVLANIKALHEGAKQLQRLTSEQFQRALEPVFQSTVGAHFRHLLEHYGCFFADLESATLCYDARPRDLTLEQDINHALATIGQYIEQLSQLDLSIAERQLSLKDQQVENVLSTNLSRELLFLQAHTVHHYAIVAAMARAMGQPTSGDFGLAIATRKHLMNCQKAALPLDQAEEDDACAQ